MKELLKNQAIVYTIGAIIIFLIIYSVLKRTGVLQSEQKKERKAAKQDYKTQKVLVESNLTASDALNPKFYLNYPQTAINLNIQTIQDKATEFHKSMRFAGTRESKFFGTLESVNSKVELSYIASEYKKLFGKSLINDIKGDFNKKDMVSILNTISSLKTK